MNAHITTLAGSDLDDRIAAAFSGGVKSDDVKALIVEAEAASLASGEAAEQARRRALDPALTTNDVAEAAERWRMRRSGASVCRSQ